MQQESEFPRTYNGVKPVPTDYEGVYLSPAENNTVPMLMLWVGTEWSLILHGDTVLLEIDDVDCGDCGMRDHDVWATAEDLEKIRNACGLMLEMMGR